MKTRKIFFLTILSINACQKNSTDILWRPDNLSVNPKLTEYSVPLKTSISENENGTNIGIPVMIQFNPPIFIFPIRQNGLSDLTMRIPPGYVDETPYNLSIYHKPALVTTTLSALAQNQPNALVFYSPTLHKTKILFPTQTVLYSAQKGRINLTDIIILAVTSSDTNGDGFLNIRDDCKVIIFAMVPSERNDLELLAVSNAFNVRERNQCISVRNISRKPEYDSIEKYCYNSENQHFSGF